MTTPPANARRGRDRGIRSFTVAPSFQWEPVTTRRREPRVRGCKVYATLNFAMRGGRGTSAREARMDDAGMVSTRCRLRLSCLTPRELMDRSCIIQAISRKGPNRPARGCKSHLRPVWYSRFASSLVSLPGDLPAAWVGVSTTSDPAAANPFAGGGATPRSWARAPGSRARTPSRSRLSAIAPGALGSCGRRPRTERNRRRLEAGLPPIALHTGPDHGRRS
jgi:hypothetical protein